MGARPISPLYEQLIGVSQGRVTENVWLTHRPQYQVGGNVADFLPIPAQYANLSFVVLTFGLTLAIYLAFRYQVNFWWLNFWYSLPFFGKLARLSKDTTRSSNPGWLCGEETLCGDYRTHITTASKAEFYKRLIYIRKAQDRGRKPLPGWMVVILAILLLVEGLGFSYLLGTWMAREGSANVHTLLLTMVFVICTILLFLTHAAGHQLYRSGLIRRSDKEWREGGRHGDFRSAEVMLDDDQLIDDRAAPYTQTVNRVGITGGYAIVRIAIAAIVAITAISTWMRVGHPNSEMIAAFIMLAIIFTVTQIVSICAGFKYGFGGEESEAAFKGTRGFLTYADHMDRVEPMIQAAQAKLQTLQRNLAALGGNVRLNLHKTFDDYIRESEARRLAIEIKRLGEVDKTLEGYRPITYKKTGNSIAIVEAFVLVAMPAYFGVCTYAVIT